MLLLSSIVFSGEKWGHAPQQSPSAAKIYLLLPLYPAIVYLSTVKDELFRGPNEAAIQRLFIKCTDANPASVGRQDGCVAGSLTTTVSTYSGIHEVLFLYPDGGVS